CSKYTGRDRLINTKYSAVSISVKYKVLLVLGILSLFSILLGLEEMFNKTSVEFLLENRGLREETSSLLIRRKVIYNIPLATFIYYLSIESEKKNKSLLFILLLFVLITKNPLLEKRNGLGPTYLLILFIYFQNFLKGNFR